jgi:hypothetical protein
MLYGENGINKMDKPNKKILNIWAKCRTKLIFTIADNEIKRGIICGCYGQSAYVIFEPRIKKVVTFPSLENIEEDPEII